jgi:Zn-dependent metalloprotease
MKTKYYFLVLMAATVLAAAQSDSIQVIRTDNITARLSKDDRIREQQRICEIINGAERAEAAANAQMMDIARQYIIENRDHYKIDSVIRDLRPLYISTDSGFRSTVHVGQFYKGIPVENGGLNLVFDSARGEIQKVHDNIIEIESLDVNPVISFREALKISKNSMQDKSRVWGLRWSPYLLIIKDSNNQLRLCWRFDESFLPNGELRPKEWRFSIDAITGSIVNCTTISGGFHEIYTDFNSIRKYAEAQKAVEDSQVAAVVNTYFVTNWPSLEALNPGQEFRVREVRLDPRTLEQTVMMAVFYKGIPVLGGGIVVVVDANDKIIEAKDNIVRGLKVEVNPAITPLEAVEVAKTDLTKSCKRVRTSDPTLAIWVDERDGHYSDPKLCWRYIASCDYEYADSYTYYVDAKTGAKIRAEANFIREKF